MSKPIEGVKLIRHNMGGVDNPDDPTYPYKMELVCRVPGLMEVAASIFGREEVVIRAKTKEALLNVIAANEFNTHPRLQSLTITGPDMEKVEITPESTRKAKEASTPQPVSV